MEKYIRQKYQHRSLQEAGARASLHRDSGSTSSDEPPPLPPKPEQGFLPAPRSVSSTYPVSGHVRRGYDPRASSPLHSPRQIPPPSSRDKPSQVFGATIVGSSSSLEAKLSKLKEMGFSDETRNATILISADGSLERAVETMMAMGEQGLSPPIRPRPAPAAQDLDVAPGRSASMTVMHHISSNNPFDAITAQPTYASGNTSFTQPAPGFDTMPSSSQARGFAQDPFGITNSSPATQAHPLQSSFASLQISNPLFPHSTGGAPTHRPETMIHRQAQTPPVPSLPFFHGQSVLPHQAQQRFTNGNPFLAPSNHAYFSMGAPTDFQQPQSPWQGAQYSTPVRTGYGSLGPAAGPVQAVPTPPQQTGRVDKSAILSLFSRPELAPARPAPFEGGGSASAAATDSITTAAGSQASVSRGPQPHPRSVSSPVGPLPGSRNPFARDVYQGGRVEEKSRDIIRHETHRHVSQDSMDLGTGASGRHSPDAFANLSARSIP